MRIAVIGDVGGHATSLRQELARLGASPDGSLPEDLIVVQVGDLIHRGPESAQVIDIVDRYLRTQPAQWIQLIGNHEVNYLQPAIFAWPEALSSKHTRILKGWWRNGTAVVAAAIETTAYESILITHAGVTAEFWASILGGPPTAAEAARTAARLGGRPDAVQSDSWPQQHHHLARGRHHCARAVHQCSGHDRRQRQTRNRPPRRRSTHRYRPRPPRYADNPMACF